MDPLVLVVEDYEDTQELYCEFLSGAGFRVAGATTGEEAVDKARELLPDVILMDLSLPGIDGYEATRQIRRDPRAHKSVIVALTGHAGAGISASVRRAGCDAYLAKPCMPMDLISAIRRLLDEKR